MGWRQRGHAWAGTGGGRARAIRVALMIGLSIAIPHSTRGDSLGVPNFWNPENRPDPVKLSLSKPLRFALDPTFPPFAFEDAQGRLRGFNVELTREICQVLAISCTLEVRQWNVLLSDLETDRADVLISGHRPESDLLGRTEMTHPYFKLPARFIVRKGTLPANTIRPADLEAKQVGVIASSAHAAFLRTFFEEALPVPFTNRNAMRAALQNGTIRALFDDAAGNAHWLDTTGQTCCHFAGGAYLNSYFFGDGMTLLVRKGEYDLRNALEYALYRLYESGEFAELYLRHFSVEIF